MKAILLLDLFIEPHMSVNRISIELVDSGKGSIQDLMFMRLKWPGGLS